MSHLVCPLCGKNAPLSTLDPDNIELDLKVVSFRGLGRGKGFVKSEEYSVFGDDEITPIIANKVVKLYYMFINNGILTDYNYTKVNELKTQCNSKDSEISSLKNDIKEKNEEIKEREIRSHVDYIILQSLSLDKSARLDFSEDSYYMVITPKTTPLNLFLLFLVQEIPSQLKIRLLQHVNTNDFPQYLQILKSEQKRRSVAAELAGGAVIFKGLNYSDIDSYSLKFNELKTIIIRAKERVYNPEEEMENILKENIKRLKNL